MKKLHKLVISTYIGPFVLTFFITLFILVMQFLWKYIDDLVGKGLEWYIIAELLFYASANLVPMALPLAILLSSIMTFGNLGENYELVAMKSSGLSLQRIMFPLIVLSFLTSGVAFYFSNNIWPKANLKFASLLYDVRQKKPAIDIKEGVFYGGLEGYVIRIGNKNQQTQEMYDILIYDHTEKKGNTKVIKAESGTMQMSDDEIYLVLTLKNGSSYEEVTDKSKSKGSAQSRPMFRSTFTKEIIRFDLSGFQMQRSDEDLFKDNYQMLSLGALETSIDTLYAKLERRKKDYHRQITRKLLPYRDSIPIQQPIADTLAASTLLTSYPPADQARIMDGAINLARQSKSYVSAMGKEFKSRKKTINRHKVEWHRKFTLSIACLVLFFIGAPLGAIIRKGGLGMPVIVSVIFFLVFHVTSITGEKIAKDGLMEPWLGMWLATFILSPIGIYLTWKATTDSPVLDRETYSRIFEKLFGWIGRLFQKSKAPA